MLAKINLMQWRKMVHRNYTFTLASSHQNIHPVSKVIVETRLWFNSFPVHRSLSHAWQSIPEYCNFFPMDRYFHECRILVPSLYELFWTCYTHPPNSFKFGSHVQLYSQFLHFSWQIYLWCLKFSLQSHFYPPPFLCMDMWCLQMMDFSIYGTFQIIFIAPIG